MHDGNWLCPIRLNSCNNWVQRWCIAIGRKVRFTLTFLAPPLIFPYFFFPCFNFFFCSFSVNFFFYKSTAIFKYWLTICSWHTHFYRSAILFTLYYREITAFFLFLIFTNFLTSGRRTRSRRVMSWYEVRVWRSQGTFSPRSYLGRSWISFGTTWNEMRLGPNSPTT